MEKMTIYHNPRCSKSRETLKLIESQGIEPDIILYLKTPLTIEELKALRATLPLEAMVRTNEPEFKALNLSLSDEQAVLEAIVKEPKLLQRPIVCYKGNVTIGRPPENIMNLLA